MENGVYNYDRLHVERSKNGELEFTNNKVLLSYFEPREYPRNGQRYPKSENYLIDSISSRFQRQKLDEHWFTNH